MATTFPAGQRGLRVLSLDGGGVRGLSTLYILDRLMYRLTPETDPRRRVKPCEVFDVIVGTSTGGLIAIMLGILEMDVQSCIKAYQNLAKDIFTPRRRTYMGGAFLHNLFGSSTFSAQKLELGIRKIIRDNGRGIHSADQNGVQTRAGGEAYSKLNRTDSPGSNGAGDVGSMLEEIPMLVEGGQRCKVFVCCTLDNGRAYRIRSYKSKYDPGLPFTVWQAARATSAAPSFFDPLSVKDITTLRDGSLRNNNPINEVIDEVHTEFSDHEISCLVSIGTGVSKTEFFGNGLVSIARACARIATDTDEAERTFRNNHASPNQVLHDCYFRFEVEQGLQDVGMEEWKNTEHIWGVTTSYLNDPIRRDMFGKCAVKLGGPETATEPIPVVEEPHCSEVLIRHHEFLGFHSTEEFVGRNADMSWLENSFCLKTRPSDPALKQRPVVAALTGLGGSGKTQLMLRYAETHLDTYSAVFWIDARSEHTILESFRLIARILNIGSATCISLDKTQQSSALIRKTDVEDIYSFKMWIQARCRPWLLLFDNLEDILLTSSISKFFPSMTLSPGSIIITSRRRLKMSGWLFKKIDCLDPVSARQLLFRHGQVSNPSETQIAQAERIVLELGHFPLSVSLAGCYIQVVGTIDRYMIHYKERKRDLLKKALGKPVLDAYHVSVLIAWQTSLDLLPQSAIRLFHLFCALDRNNISVDLLRRACSPKQRWDSNGELTTVLPIENGVPSWFLRMCLSKQSEWDELPILEDIFRLESLFFLHRENIEGSWTYGGHVVKNFSEGNDSLIIRMESFVQELGRLMLEDKRLQEYGTAAICIAVHSIEDDAKKSIRLKEISSDLNDNFVALLPTGGMSNNALGLMLTLEESFGHIKSASECYPKLDQYLKESSIHISHNSRYSKSTLCWFILAGIHLGGQSLPEACHDEQSLGSTLVLASLMMENTNALYLHAENTVAHWAAIGRVCRFTEWYLWTRMCWINGTKVATRRVAVLDKLRLDRAGSATFQVNFHMLFASVMESFIAQGQRINPFKTDDVQFVGVMPARQYLDIYANQLRSHLKGHFPPSPSGLTPSPFDRHEIDLSDLLFQLLDPYVGLRPGISAVRWGSAWKVSSSESSSPDCLIAELPVPFHTLLDKFEKTALFKHIQLGAAIVTAHWVKIPVCKLVE